MTQHTYMPHSPEDTTLATPPLSDAFPNFTPERNIPAEIARSWLLVNAMKPELFDQSAGSRADSIILHTLDAVAIYPTRIICRMCGLAYCCGKAWLRIKVDGPPALWADDGAGLGAAPGSCAVLMLAKTESADQATETAFRSAWTVRRRSSRRSSPRLGIEEAKNTAKAEGAFRLGVRVLCIPPRDPAWRRQP